MINAIVFGLVGLGMFFAVIRLIKGPSVSDRVVALYTLNLIMETIVFGRYLEGKHGDR